MIVSEKREIIVETALKLFHQNGFHATGFDRIIEASGVSKRTLYQYFRSKEALIVAVRDTSLRRHR